MTYTFGEAYDIMMKIITDAWTPTGHKLFYQNIETDRDGSTNPFAWVSINLATTAQTTLGGQGKRSFNRVGLITVQIYTQAGKGLSEAHQLAKLAADAYEGKSSGGIWFRNVRVNEIGRDGEFFMTNVLIDFNYDEIK